MKFALTALVSLLLLCVSSPAQEVLPRPEPPFKGHIGRTVKDSTKDFPEETTAPKGAPNVLLILTDDVGFGASSTFGGPVPTPTMDRLAKNGLRYTQFNTCALCSPTRAALLSGPERLQHRVVRQEPQRARLAHQPVGRIFFLARRARRRGCHAALD